MTTASVGGVLTKCPIFDDSGPKIGLFLIDGVAYVDFKGIGGLGGQSEYNTLNLTAISCQSSSVSIGNTFSS